MTRRHTTSTFEFQTTGILLAGDGAHAVRVLGALAEPAALPLAKEQIPSSPEAYRDYLAGERSGDQEDPAARAYHPQVPSAYLTEAGELVFLERDWSGIDLDAVRIPELPGAPAQELSVPGPADSGPTPPATPDRWGGYDLRRGDRDGEPRWAGATRSAGAGRRDARRRAPTAFVRRLQQDLRETGFLIVGTPGRRLRPR